MSELEAAASIDVSCYITDEPDSLVEKVAEAMFRASDPPGAPNEFPWAEYDEFTREWWRHYARAAVAVQHADWERRVLERFIKTMPPTGEAPDYIHAITTAMIAERPET